MPPVALTLATVPELLPTAVPTMSVPVLLELSVTPSPSARLRIGPLLAPKRPTLAAELVIVRLVTPQTEPPPRAHHWPSRMPVNVPRGTLELKAAAPPLML